MNIRLLSFLCVASMTPMFLCADSIQVVSPKEASIVSPLKPSQRMFIMMTEQQRRKILEDTSFFNDLGSLEKSYPAGIELSWKFVGDRAHCHYEVIIGDSEELANPTVIKPPHSKHRIHNLLPGKKYYWQARAIYNDNRPPIETKVSSFIVADTAPHILNVPNVDNVRDLGGWTGLEGRKIPMGLIYRSSGLNNNSTDGGKTPGVPRFNDEGRDVLMNVMKIKTELDLRTTLETASMKVSPLGEQVKYINISTTAYGGMFTEFGRKNFAMLFRIFTKPENYPIDFHCIAGADRTGSLSFLLLSILGVSEENARLDYVLTSFFLPRGYNNADIFSKGFRAFGGKDEPLYSLAERYLLSAGITAQEIVTFREIVLGPGLKLTPALKEHLEITEQMAKFTEPLPQGCSIEQAFSVNEKFVQAGKNVRLRMPAWPSQFVRKTGCSKDGAVAFYLVNSGRLPAIAKINPPGDGKFFVGDIISKTSFSDKQGVSPWSAASFKNSLLTVMPGEQMIIAVIPYGLTGQFSFGTGKSMQNITYDTLQMLTAKSSQSPTIDGMLNDAAWLNATELPLCEIDGTPVQNPPIAKLATDAEHNNLFISLFMPDNTLCGQKHKNRDRALWEEDSCEIFISQAGHDTYYQIIVNSEGSIYDGKKNDGKWDLKDYNVATKRDKNAWTMELALPLAQFNFDEPIEINICANDNPHTKLFNLNTTNGTFHSRNSMLPVILK